MGTHDPEVVARKAQQNSTDIVSGEIPPSQHALQIHHLLNTPDQHTL